MSSAAVLGKMNFACDNVVSASSEAVLTERDERVVAHAISGVVVEVTSRSDDRRAVVELTPRHFEQTAAHFLRVATPFKWPTDEADID
jgi:hypothetical protein